MHLRILVNGTVEHVDKWKRDLAAQSVPYEYEKGKKGMFQLGIRTMEMIDVCFPEDQLPTVLQMVKPVRGYMYASLDGKKVRYPWLNKIKDWIAKRMKLEPIPEYKPIPNYLDKQFVAVHGLGLKKDLYDDNGIELL